MSIEPKNQASWPPPRVLQHLQGMFEATLEELFDGLRTLIDRAEVAGEQPYLVKNLHLCVLRRHWRLAPWSAFEERQSRAALEAIVISSAEAVGLTFEKMVSSCIRTVRAV